MISQTLILLFSQALALDCVSPEHLEKFAPKFQEINHVVIIMQENHSFDSYFGKLNRPEFYGLQVDGIDEQHKELEDFKTYTPQPYRTLCPRDPDHSWNAAHRAWNGGKNNLFPDQNQGLFQNLRSPDEVYHYLDERELPFYYSLANQFAISDRYFSSAMGPTHPNRFFLYMGTALGRISNDETLPGTLEQKSIFDLLNENHVSWKYYHSGDGGYLPLFKNFSTDFKNHYDRIKNFKRDIETSNLPQVVFLESSEDVGDEHPPINTSIGQKWVGDQVRNLSISRYWKNSVIFLTFDENGGFYDHVPPPEACEPDKLYPKENLTEFGRFDHFGFRVPFIAISPFVKHHFVSHEVYDHTSILRFLELRFQLPALTKRDANANPLSDIFDFSHPNFTVPNFSSIEKIEKNECYYPPTMLQNLYNEFRRWCQNLWLDLADFFKLS